MRTKTIEVVDALCNNYFLNRNGFKARYIILHATAGGISAQAIASYFKSTEQTNNPVSSNYIIGTDGTIVQSVLEKDAPYANGVLTEGHDAYWNPNINPNLPSIAIEFCKASTDNSDALTPQQIKSGFALIKDICQRNAIPTRKADARGGITGHYAIDPINRKRCPGTFPWQDLWNDLQIEDTSMLDLNDEIVKKYFHDDGQGNWTCINNVTLIGANLTFYRTNGGPALFGLPLSNEIKLADKAEVAIVPCERAVIIYDPKRIIDNPPILGQCYLMHTDQAISLGILQNKSDTNKAVEVDNIKSEAIIIASCVQSILKAIG